MASAEIFSGICGFKTTVDVKSKGAVCSIEIRSDCESIRRLGEALTEVDPFGEITFRGEGPQTLRLGAKYCAHPACPVPVGILKTVEVEAGLALPEDVVIRISKKQ